MIFMPKLECDQEGSITIISNDPDNPEINVSLSGTCIQKNAGDLAILQEIVELNDINISIIGILLMIKNNRLVFIKLI